MTVAESTATPHFRAASENYGPRAIGDIEFIGGYEFDILAVFQDVETGRLFYAEDSGCSCPTPFESHDRTTITPFVDPSDVRSRVKQLRAEHYQETAGDDELDSLLRLIDAARS